MRLSNQARWRKFTLATVVMIASLTSSKADEARSFDVEAGEAAKTLKLFAKQARLGIVFDSRSVEDIYTGSVVGLMTPSEALTGMLENTSLVFDQDDETGAFAVTYSETVEEARASTSLSEDVKSSSIEDVPEIRDINDEPQNTTHMKEKNQKNGGLFKGLLALAVAVVPNASAQDSGDDEVFELSPFTVDVSDDRGYRANNTLTGSRLNSSLRDTAASVSVFTEEFLEDTGLVDMQEIARYSVGSINNLQDTNPSENINNYLGAAVPVRGVRIRGIRATKGIDYFQSFIPDDGFRSERYDESRGPNGILFGISEAGGILNTSSLKANTQRDSGRIRFSTGTYERNRAEVRFNKALVENKLGVSFAGLRQDNGGWRDYETKERDRYYGAITWKASDRITIGANYEKGDHFETRIRPFNSADKFLPLYLLREKFGKDAVTFYPGRNSDFGPGEDTDNPGIELDGRDPRDNRSSESLRGQEELATMGLRVLTSRTQPRYIYNATDDYSYNGSGIWESNGFERGDTSTLDVIQGASTLNDVWSAGGSGVSGRTAKILNYEEFGFDFPRNLNAAGPKMFRTEDFEMYSASADFKLSENTFMNLAHNRQVSDIYGQFVAGSEPELRIDPNRLLRHPRNDDVDPFALNPRAGDMYFDSYWRAQEHNVESTETRAALSHDLDLGDSGFGRHRIAAGWSQRETSQQLVSNRWAFLGRPFNSDFLNSRNRVAIRTYITEGDTDSYVIGSPPASGQAVITTDDGIARDVGWVRDRSNTQNGRSDITVDSYIFALQDFFLDGKLVTTFGYRKDEAENLAFGREIDELYGPTLVTEGPDVETKVTEFSSSTKTAGAVFHLSENVSLIGNYATSIGLPEFRNLVYPSKSIPPPVEGEGSDFGIGFSALNNRISGRLVYYDVEAINRTTSGGGTRIIADPLNQSMRGLDQARQSFIDGDSDLMVVKADGNPYTDAEWEAEIADLNGAVDGGVTPSNEINAFLMDEYTEGYELSLTANITENWRLTVNASYTDRILDNYGREFAKSVGWQLGEDGRYIEPITVNANGSAAIATDTSLYADGSIYQRIVDIANRVTGTFVDEDGDSTVLNGNGSLFINSDGNYDSVNDDETIAYRAWQSLSGNNNAYLQQNIDEREKRWGLNPYKFNLFTAYDFNEGMLKGFTVGGGYRWLDGAIIGEDADGNEFSNSAEGTFDLLLRYRQKLGNGNRIDYQINVYNLLDENSINPVRYTTLNDPTSRLSRFDLPAPQEVRATVTYSF
ncbi:hypothetical protein N8787_02585 [Opitutaceae bacterium]|nr:hypothetical protein [Opitutaceae bacterium]